MIAIAVGAAFVLGGIVGVFLGHAIASAAGAWTEAE